MTISPHLIRRCRKAIAVVGTIAAISVPVAQAQPQPQNYGPLDPWAYSVLHRGTQATTRSVPPGTGSMRIVKPDGFDWRDAAIGAASALGLMLLAGGITLAARRGHAAPTRA